MSLSCTISEMLSLISHNLKTLRDLDHAHSRKGHFVITMLNRHMVNQCTKFEISSCSRDILGGTENLNGSRGKV